MALGTLTSRITGIFRDIALVAAIGTAIFADTYSVANSIPNIIYILIAGGAINAVFIPALDFVIELQPFFAWMSTFEILLKSFAAAVKYFIIFCLSGGFRQVGE